MSALRIFLCYIRLEASGLRIFSINMGPDLENFRLPLPTLRIILRFIRFLRASGLRIFSIDMGPNLENFRPSCVGT